LSSRFRFHGYAIGVAGQLTEPFTERIDVQATTALPAIGGYGSAEVRGLRRRELLRVDRVFTSVAGDECDCEKEGWSAVTRLEAVAEGLDILGVVTADRVVANLVSTYRKDSDGEPSVRLLGTRFDNLRIAGIPVKVDLATDVFDRYDTHRALAHAYKSDRGVRELFERVMLKDEAERAPSHVQRWFCHTKHSDELPETRGVTRMSLVRGTEAERQGLSRWGHVFHVPGFGTIRLAEVEITRLTRVVNMIQIKFDCPYKGQVMCMSVGDGGEPNGQFDL
jgi:hypothetical protein